SEGRDIALPSVEQEGVADRGFTAADRHWNHDHAPAGSAGGAPSTGVRTPCDSTRAASAVVLLDAAGGLARGGSGRLRARRSRSSRSIVSRSSRAIAIR